MKELELKGLSEQDTARIGEKLGEGLFPGGFIALYGGLGAGKIVAFGSSLPCVLCFAWGRWGCRPKPCLRDIIPQAPFFASRGFKQL